MTRAAVAAACGKSSDWLKSIEIGKRSTPLPMLLRLADVLHVADLTELVGRQVRTMDYARPGHDGLDTVRRALTAYPLAGATDEPPTLDRVRARLDGAWRTWHTSPHQRTEIGRVLPGLVHEAEQAADTHNGHDRHTAQALLSEVYHLAQAYLAWQAEPRLVWLVADRAMAAARASGDPLAVAGAAFYLAHLIRACDGGDEAQDLVSRAAESLRPRLGDDPNRLLPIYGHLWLCAALTAARERHEGEARRHFDKAAAIVPKLPDGYAHPWHGFGRAIVDLYDIMIDVEVGQAGEAQRKADQLDPSSIPSVERRSRHWIELARGAHHRGDHLATASLLHKSWRASPETLTYSPSGRSLISGLVDNGGATVREDALKLATRVGLIAA
ncbi:transcriptional regulator [Embleya hyalina]|uniref:Transcriptional regulator n=2 Tax=Embleya hyalina TaxID=516124 RepID=A0A401YQQ9_9ACTN|nr:transcriptional regulator [Embleya hyalina]